jgi:alanine dehydrogenase
MKISKPTTHNEPTYLVDPIVHYMVTNVPGALSRVSTCELSYETLSYALSLEKLVFEAAAVQTKPWLEVLTSIKGSHLSYTAVADAVNVEYRILDEVL